MHKENKCEEAMTPYRTQFPAPHFGLHKIYILPSLVMTFFNTYVMHGYIYALSLVRKVD